MEKSKTAGRPELGVVHISTYILPAQKTALIAAAESGGTVAAIVRRGVDLALAERRYPELTKIISAVIDRGV